MHDLQELIFANFNKTNKTRYQGFNESDLVEELQAPWKHDTPLPKENTLRAHRYRVSH